MLSLPKRGMKGDTFLRPNLGAKGGDLEAKSMSSHRSLVKDSSFSFDSLFILLGNILPAPKTH